VKVLAIISARGGSKGVPRKNMKMLGGHPLVTHMIRAAQQAKLVDRLIVSTDDEEIADCARSEGADVPFMRNHELGGDRIPLVEVTKDGMEQMDDLGYRADVIVQLSPTCPFVGPSRIDESIEMVRGGADSAVSVKRIEHEHPYRAKVIEDDGYFRSFVTDVDVEMKYQSRQDLPELYCTCGAIYTRRRELLKHWRGDFAFGDRPFPVILNEIEAINIDTPLDFILADFILKEQNRLEDEGMIPRLVWP